jgi:hypothetical protein
VPQRPDGRVQRRDDQEDEHRLADRRVLEEDAVAAQRDNPGREQSQRARRARPGHREEDQRRGRQAEQVLHDHHEEQAGRDGVQQP